MSKKTEKAKSLPFFGVPKLYPYVRHYGHHLVYMVALCLLGSVIDVALPLFQRYALNHYVAGRTLDTLPYFLALYVFAIVFSAVMNYLSTYRASCVEVWIGRDLRNLAFNHLQTLSFSYFNQNSVGYIHSRIMSDTSRIGVLFSWSIMEFVWQMSYLVGAIAVMLVVNARLALLVMLILPLVSALFSVFQTKLIRINREVREMNSRITGDFNEGITGARTIKTLAIEDKMDKDFVADTGEMRSTSVRAARLRGLFQATMSFASSLALAIVLWQGGVIAESEIGTFTMFMSYAQGMMEPVRWLIDAISDLITTQVNIERLTKLLETKSDVTDSPEVIERYGDCFDPKRENWEEIRGDIEFDDVSFRYPDGDETVLEHFNLKIPFGSNIAIVGETGAGKSTLVNLICRFYEPSSGRVLIDGRDARERSQLWLHSSLGYVLQTPHLFSGTVRENLLYGKPDATEEQIARALELVSATEVVQRLEKGLDTDVGEGGDLLSTGEKQLLSFARAILADPKILVLDEATSSVDTMTEQKIQRAIDTIVHGRTSVVIAHRLSTVRDADCIL
ncbi:MAG: ABC transporter ATP-binding protein/permease, partial [Atopobiaceae bacterium]|nr:ABC transporter ATP-binding protein/permease [Atopobiaceae bacterium]